MSAPRIPLAGSHKNILQTLVTAPHLSPDFARQGEANPALRVFVANFDGTWNDCNKIPKGESPTIVAQLHQESAAFNNAIFESHYVHGVGSRTGKFRALWEGTKGSGCKERSEVMHELLMAAATRWKEENPNAQIHVHVTGFSRGAASGLHFMNLVNDFGACTRTLNEREQKIGLARGVGPGQVHSSAVLLDIVATGQEKILTLTVPPTAQSVLHLTAGGEERRHFKLVSLGDERYDAHGQRIEGANNVEWAQARNVGMPPPSGFSPFPVNEDGSVFYQRIRQIEIPGARHSDVGGGYDNGGLAGMPKYLARSFQYTLGIPGATPSRPTFASIQQCKAHDSRDKIEFSLQALEDMARGKLRKVGKRLQIKRKERHWDGDTLDTVTLTLRAADGNIFATKTRKRVTPLSAGETAPTDQSLGHGEALVYNPMGLGNVVEDKSQHLTLDPETMAIHHRGARIDDSDSRDSLVGQMSRNSQPLWLEVSVAREKIYCELQDGRQLPGVRPVHFDFGSDPWSYRVRDAIQLLNERTHANPANGQIFTPIDESLANTLIGQALQSSSAHALELPDIDAITFELGEPEGPNHDVPVRALIEHKGQSTAYPFKGPAFTPEEVARRRLVTCLAEGVEQVTNMLADAGHHFCGQCFRMIKGDSLIPDFCRDDAGKTPVSPPSSWQSASDEEEEEEEETGPQIPKKRPRP